MYIIMGFQDEVYVCTSECIQSTSVCFLYICMYDYKLYICL